MLRVLSLGAGVQSSTLAMLFERGEILEDGEPVKLDVAIFADTGAEPAEVYRFLDSIEARVTFPVLRVMWEGGLEQNLLDSLEGGRFAGAPFFTESDTGREGRLRRQCTREFKVQPITRKLRELVGLKKGERAPKRLLVRQYIGISWDEAVRMKPAREHWIEHRWPLIDLRWTRQHCLDWWAANDMPAPPRSACYFCPYKSDQEWQRLKEQPEEWQRAIRMDELIRKGVRGTTQRLYLHRSLKPLAEVDLRTAEQAGQQTLFGEECEGMCGV